MGPRTAVLTGLAFLAVVAPARAATFTVNTTADTSGPVGCPAFCTIRGAIGAAAANNLTDDVVAIPAGTYTLNPQLGALSVPASATRITIDGAGANTTFIQPASDQTTAVLAIGSSAGVVVRDLTVRNGVSATAGGNVSVASQANVTLDSVRVRNGSAPQGGGIGVLGAASITIQSSLIDANFTTGSALTSAGGGLYVQGQTTATAITIQDSTITANGARNGAGIAIDNNTAQPPALRGVTLTRNAARAGTGFGVGGIYAGSTTARFQGSIVTGNTTTINTGRAPVVAPANCALASAAIDDGGNVTADSADQCGLGGVHTDPQLAAQLDASQPPALAIAADSSAVDIAACGARTVDQRGVARPQGAACDAGAYEVEAAVPQTPPTESPPIVQPQQTATPTPTPAPSGVRVVSGTVLMKVGGKFVRLDPAKIKNGTEIDTRKGVIEITTPAGDVARFYAGLFKLSQSAGLTTLTLSEKLDCSKKGKARAAAEKPKTRKLWGEGKGRFKTKGSYSAATVRGTKWLVQDTCTSTLTRVTQGVVAVQDFVKGRTVVVRQGKRYTARAKKR